jgi:hypothetical protein
MAVGVETGRNTPSFRTHWRINMNSHSYKYSVARLTRLNAAISSFAIGLVCLTAAVAADQPTWAELQKLFGQKVDSPSAEAFIRKYDLQKSRKFDEGSYKPKDNSFSFMFKRDTFECAVLKVTQPAWGDRNWVPYSLPLPFGLVPTNTFAQLSSRLGVTNGGPGKWIIGEYKVYPIFRQRTNSIEDIFIWNTNIVLGPFPFPPGIVPTNINPLDVPRNGS